MEFSEGKTAKKRRIPRWFWHVLGYGISVSSLIWVYHGFDWKTELPKLAQTDWRWVAVAVLVDILVYVCQGYRWSLLLSPVVKAPLWKTVQAIYIGLFANEVLPFRTGEVIRCYLQARWTALPFPVIVSSAIIERLFDGIWLFLAFYGATFFVELPKILVEGSKVMAVLLSLIGLLAVVAIFWKHHAHAAVSRSKWPEALASVVDGLHSMGQSRSFVLSFLLSLFYLVLQVVPIYALIRGFGFDLSFWSAATVLVILRLGSIPPQAPGNVGSFQLLTIAGLSLFGIDRATATGFATLLFAVVTVPLWLAGFVALMATRMELGEIRQSAQNMSAAAQGPVR
ncbi:MAG: lysylphosphatidylglycerol synthase transmembrane domain-containing protein [Acidobacteria bacterium]|nr:lysylphosphatidylglycerol synthase transmembrane domain-containing protein [Acidobacteriota bacterium]